METPFFEAVDQLCDMIDKERNHHLDYFYDKEAWYAAVAIMVDEYRQEYKSTRIQE